MTIRSGSWSIILSVLCLPSITLALQEYTYDSSPFYVPHIEFGGYYFTDAPHTAGIARAFMPLGIDDPNHLLYVDARGIVKKGGLVREGNLGLGYRQLNTQNNKLHGIYGFFDRKRTSGSMLFSQLTLGLEYWHNKFFAGANAYIPVGQHVASQNLTTSSAALNQTSPGTYNILVTTINNTSTEVALIGADLEVGYQFTDNLVAYLGAYSFSSSSSSIPVKGILGPLLNVQYIFYPGNRLFLGTFDRVTLENQLQWDSTRGTRWYGGIRFSIALGKSDLSVMQRHMVDPAFRDIDIVAVAQQSTSRTVALATNAAGQTMQVRTATTAADVTSFAADPTVTVIAIDGTVTLGSTTAITLSDYQTLTGGNLTFNFNNQTYTVPVTSNGELKAASGGALLVVKNNNSIQNITLTMQNPVNNAAGNTAIAANSGTNDLGTLALSNVSSNGILRIARSGASQTGIVTVNNCNFTTPSTWEPTDLPAVAQFDIDTSSTLKVLLQNSTFRANSSTQQVVGVRFRPTSGAAITVQDVNTCIIDGTDVGLVNQYGAGSLRYLGGISNCSIDGGSGALPSEGGILSFSFSGNNSFIMDGAIKNNVITATDVGISFRNFGGSTSTVQIAQGIINNTITSPDQLGININPGASDTLQIIGLHGNRITTGAASDISVNQPGTTVRVESGTQGLSAANFNARVTTSGSPTIIPGT
jgi:hypothetical protein